MAIIQESGVERIFVPGDKLPSKYSLPSALIESRTESRPLLPSRLPLQRSGTSPDRVLFM
jgi:hypothetical protein